MEISHIVEQVDILEYISQYADFTEKNGEFWALSPLKEENTPSFSVNTTRQRFYDFSSGRGGDVLTFIQAYNKCDVRTAIDKLKAYAGISEAVEGGTPIIHLNAVKVAKRYAGKKRNSKQSKAVVLPDDYMSRYEGNHEKLAIWEDKGISRATLDKFQVKFDAVQNRLVHPIRNIEGKIINVSGRTVDPEWKTKGLRKYTYFYPLGVLDTIYGLSENREVILKAREIILFEGAKSVMLAHSWGIENTGAVLTSHINREQMKILAGLGVAVTFALDKDVVVNQDENIQRLCRFCTIKVVIDEQNLLGEKDAPVDKGKEVWDRLYESRVDFVKKGGYGK